MGGETQPLGIAQQFRAFQPGAGVIRSIIGTNPAVNTELGEVVPAGKVWALRSFRGQLVTDANVANRSVVFGVDDDTLVSPNFMSGPNVLQTATQTIDYICAPTGNIGTIASAKLACSMPQNYLMLSGWRIRTLTSAIQAGDDWGSPRYVVEEYTL